MQTQTAVKLLDIHELLIFRCFSCKLNTVFPHTNVLVEWELPEAFFPAACYRENYSHHTVLTSIMQRCNEQT